MASTMMRFINDYLAEHHGTCVRCEETKTRGRILVAGKAYEKGEVIFREAACRIVAED